MSDTSQHPALRSPFAVGDSSPSPGVGRVCIVTDSTADILPNHARSIGVVVVPTRLHLDGEVLRDGIDITAPEYYTRLPHLRTPPHTEPPSPQEFYHAYQAAFRQGASAVVSLHISGHLSATVRNAMAARDHLFPAPITVIDTQQVGIGMWPAVIHAAQLAHAGAPPRVIYDTVTSILARTRMYGVVESLEQLRRNGRIGRAQELLGTLLDTHPIITVNQGEVTPVETVRPRARALLRLRELVQAAGTLEILLVCGTSNESISQIESTLAADYPGAIHKTWLGPAIGVHTGPCVGAAIVTRP